MVKELSFNRREIGLGLYAVVPEKEIIR